MERIITYTEAIREATEQEMERDSSVVLLGIGVDDFKGLLGTTKGLQEKFGKERVFDTPLAEDGMTGAAIGMALAGLRPIHAHLRMDFLMLAMNQLVNIAAKARYMYGGAVSVPLVVRSIIGKSWGQGGQHSQGLHSFFMHVPGLKVVAPSTPYDAKGCLVQSIRDNNPVIFVEQRMLHFQKGHVPEELYTVPFGKARVLKQGSDVTVVGISYMSVESLRAARYLEDINIDAEVIDPISLSPLDINTIVASVKKTGRLMVVDTAWTSCGATAEIITRVMEALGSQHFQARRMGFQPVTCPTSKSLENLFYPNARTIAREIHHLVKGNDSSWIPEGQEAKELIEFRGPF